MALDPRYVTAPALEQCYIDKTTGLPLANGTITFYKDTERTILKSIYTLSGAPQASYVELPNPITLSAVGTIQDANGNNVLPFYFPFDKDGNDERYYITVMSAQNVLQFTREGWPNTGLDLEADNDTVINFIPNGQFLMHRAIPAQGTHVAGEITQAITTLAPGGWTFNRTEKSLAKDIVVFERFGSSVSNPSGYPRYAIRIENQYPSPGDLIKDLRISFRNVNRFASQKYYYNLAFAAQTNTGNTLSITALVIKNFGEGGSPLEEKIINTVTLTSAYTLINIPFIFGDNQTKTLGIKDDDTLTLALRFPTTSVFDASLTDFSLTHGTKALDIYPQVTDSTVVSVSLAGSFPVPDANGFDEGLPIYYQQGHLFFYSGDVGKIYPAMYDTPRFNERLCDGTRYRRSAYTTEGIPYARVAQTLWDDALGFYRSGNGASFVTATLDAHNKLILTTNQPNAANDAEKGTTGLTIETVFPGKHLGFNTYLSENELGHPIRILCESISVGYENPPKAETSGFVITDTRNAALTKHVFQIDCIEAKDLAGKYFSFSSPDDYYIWFTVDGKGDDPKPKDKKIGFKLPLIGTQTAEEVAIYLAEFFAGHQLTTIEFLPAKEIKPGSYWTFHTSTPETFSVRIGKTNAPPSLDETTIDVEWVETDTAEQVAQKTKLAINQFFFATPDLRGVFLRGFDEHLQIDLGYRYFAYGQGLIKNHIGSFQLDEIYSHNHPPLNGGKYAIGNATTAVASYQTFSINLNFAENTGDRGSEESRPYNVATNFVIKI